MKLVPEVAEFDHFLQASWLIKNPDVLDAGRFPGTFDRFEKVFAALNGLLS